MEPKLLITKTSTDYELIDSGDEEKLERYGKYILRRPDPQALWKKSQPESDWKNASAIFIPEMKKWRKKDSNMQNEWQISLSDLKFNIKPTPFKHTGIFPEQEENWKFIKSKIKAQKLKEPKKIVRVLNLFGYTGGATLTALSVGAEVTHIDGSKSAITWAKENALINNLDKKPVRWIVDDVRKFVIREIKRGSKYDAIIMDPPSFGKGGKNELWKIEKNFLDLLDSCAKILSENPLFFLINGYSSGYSSQAYYNSLKPLMEKYDGEFEIGELTIQESKGKRLLPCGIFARWSI